MSDERCGFGREAPNSAGTKPTARGSRALANGPKLSPRLDFREIHRLWVLDTIVRTGSLRRAATTLRVTPSAVSQMLTSLEQRLGRALVVRDQGDVRPSAYCLDLLERVRPAFSAFAAALARPEPVQNLQIGSLSFGTSESLAISVVPPLMASLREYWPKIRLKMLTERPAQLLAMIRKGELCMALVPEAPGLERFYVEEVGRDNYGFFCARSLPEQRRRWSLVEEIGWATQSQGAEGPPLYLSRGLRSLALPTPPTLTSASFEVLRAAACQGRTVALLPKRVGLRHDDLCELPTPKADFSAKTSHRLLLLSPENCDREESAFLAAEIRRVLAPAH